MNKTVERMITGGAIAALIAVFFYQVAYGQTAMITAPPGSTITNLTITPITNFRAFNQQQKDSDNIAKLLIGTWNFVNETNASSISGKITFYPSQFEITPVNGSCAIVSNCKTGYWSTDGHTLQLCC